MTDEVQMDFDIHQLVVHSVVVEMYVARRPAEDALLCCPLFNSISMFLACAFPVLIILRATGFLNGVV
jgi:hypothetical protein